LKYNFAGAQALAAGNHSEALTLLTQLAAMGLIYDADDDEDFNSTNFAPPRMSPAPPLMGCISTKTARPPYKTVSSRSALSVFFASPILIGKLLAHGNLASIYSYAYKSGADGIGDLKNTPLWRRVEAPV